jgi:hypothetical protein
VSPEGTCAVCGRTVLAGEQVHGFLAGDGRRDVCELCVSRAERLGWRKDGDGDDGAPDLAQKRRGPRLAGLLWRRRTAEAEPGDPPPPSPGPDPAAPGMRIERALAAPSALSPFERAVARFNASDASHTVDGLVRTLGRPSVSVGASAGAPSEIRITIAWELSWYQWGVDLGDELRPIFEIGKGSEMDQLDSAARQWNASAVEGGGILLVAPCRGAAGAPAGH